MQRLATILPSVLRQRGLDQAFCAGLVVLKGQQWIQDVLPVHKAALVVRSIQDGALLIHAHNSIALQEMVVRSDELIDWLTQEIPAIGIGTIKVVRA